MGVGAFDTSNARKAQESGECRIKMATWTQSKKLFADLPQGIRRYIVACHFFRTCPRPSSAVTKCFEVFLVAAQVCIENKQANKQITNQCIILLFKYSS